MQGPVQRWTFDGPLMPCWVRFLNWAIDGDTFVAHQFEGAVAVRRGQALCRDARGFMWAE